MAVRANLPAELALQVLQELDSGREQTPTKNWSASRRDLKRVNQDLLNCLYVSRQFRALVEPLFYSRIYFPTSQFWHINRGQFYFRPFSQLTRTLALRPELAKHVRELDTSLMEANCEYICDQIKRGL
ncbi:hypothetical protein DL93DRAFT_493417 [Clavulina sp. PMI_390]|nr:hypothetical protein DL93DRAFT_493417 [Clavulina sp. PMI_390]